MSAESSPACPPRHKTHSTLAWMLVHVIFPLIPFVIEGLLRCLILGFRFDSFSSATLSASMALICFFIHQSLIAHCFPMPNDKEGEQSVGWTATLFLIFAVFSIVLFGAVVLLAAIVEQCKTIQDALRILWITTLIFCCIPIPFAYFAQRSFKLRATL